MKISASNLWCGLDRIGLALLSALWLSQATAGGGLPTVSISSSDTNGDEAGSDSASFTVTRAGGELSKSLTVGISLTGSAELGRDYTLDPAFVTAVAISANEPSVTVELNPRADNFLEGLEQAVVTLTANPAVYQLGETTSTTIDIADDPIEVILTSVDTDASEAGPDAASFTVTRTGGDVASGLTVGISLTGSAALGADYQLNPAFRTAVAISGGQPSVTVELNPLADNLVEGLEQATVTLTANSAVYELGDAISATIDIVDDPVAVSISSNDPTASEIGADPASFTVTRSGGNIGSSLTVGINISGSATLNSDYSLTPAFVTAVAIPANDSSITVLLTPLVSDGDLPDDEGEETITIQLQEGDYEILNADSVTLTLSDNDLLFSDSLEASIK